MKIRLLGGELSHADRRTEMTELIVPFRNFANAPKNGCTEINPLYNPLFKSIINSMYIHFLSQSPKQRH